jgi:hypothetical protein
LDAVETNTTPLVSFTYAVDGVATDPVPDSATVTITRADGTVLHTNAATTNAGTGVFTYSLSVSDTSLLDVLTLEWHIGTQTFTTKIEVQGGFYFTISEALAIRDLVGKSPSEIAAVRTLAEQAFEDAAGVAFVPRYERVDDYADPRRAHRPSEVTRPSNPRRERSHVSGWLRCDRPAVGCRIHDRGHLPPWWLDGRSSWGHGRLRVRPRFSA